jgi:hypothetical protein
MVEAQRQRRALGIGPRLDLRLNAVAYLSKPVRLDRLVMVVDRYCVGGS